MSRLFGAPGSIAATARPGTLAVLYDGECAPCRRAIHRLERFDNTGAPEMIDLHSRDARARFAELEIGALLYEMHVIDDRGRVYRGARGVNEIIRRQRGPRRFAALLWYVPGVAWTADRIYKFVAARRHRGGCATAPT